jgi:hypothetical protein
MGWTVHGSNPAGGKIFLTCLGLLWGPLSLLYNGYSVSFPGVKCLGRGVDHPPPYSAEVKERVQLLTPPRRSWLVTGWKIPLPYKGYWWAMHKICLRFLYMNSSQNSNFISSIPFLLKKSQCKEQINQAVLTCFFLNSRNVMELLFLKLVFLKQFRYSEEMSMWCLLTVHRYKIM